MAASAQLSNHTAASPNGLPQGWRMARFGDVVKNVNAQERNPLENGIERYIGLDHLEPGSLHLRRWGLVAEGTTFTRRFEKGQVLFAKRRAYQRKVAVAEFGGVCSGDILVFEAKSEILLPELLPFIVESDGFFEYALQTSAGSLSPRTRWNDLARYQFPLPPREEQRRIADILWAADEALQSKENLIASLEIARRAFIDKLIPDPASLGDHGSIATFGDVCSMQNGRAFPSRDYSQAGIRLLRPGNLAADGYFSWPDEDTRYLPLEHLELSEGYLVKAGDVVINLTAQSLEEGFMGRVCLAQVGDESLLNQRIGRFICGKEIEPEFLFRCCQTTRFRKWVESRCEGSKIRHMYWRHIESFPIVLPDHQKQMAVIEAAKSVDANLIHIRSGLKDSVLVKGALQNKFLAREAPSFVQRS